MPNPIGLYMEIVAALRAGDNSVTVKFFHPDFVVHEDPGMPYGGEKKGAEAFIKLRQHVYDTWGKGSLELLYVCGDSEGDHAAAYFKLSGHPHGKTELVESNVTVMWTFRNNLAVEARVFYYDTPRLTKALTN